jgi:hypothetical protein
VKCTFPCTWVRKQKDEIYQNPLED